MPPQQKPDSHWKPSVQDAPYAKLPIIPLGVNVKRATAVTGVVWLLSVSCCEHSQLVVSQSQSCECPVMYTSSATAPVEGTKVAVFEHV